MGAKTCLNCESQLQPAQQFCSRCGQKATLHRLSWHDVVHDVSHYFTHADKGIFGLVRDLARKTGLVAAEYMAGRRKRYFPPINFFLIVAGLYVLAFGYFSHRVAEGAAAPTTELSSAAKNLPPQVVMRQQQVSTFTSKHSNWLSILSLPVTAFIYRLFYRRRQYNFVEHLVANMYMNGFTLLCMAVLFVLIAAIWPRAPLWVVGVFVLLQVLYNAAFYRRFMHPATQGHFGKALLASLAGVVVWVLLVFAALSLYVQFGFFGIGEK